jgi:hypothetical protein
LLVTLAFIIRVASDFLYYSYRVATDLAKVIARCFLGGVAQGDSGLDVVGSGGVAVVVGHFWCALCCIFFFIEVSWVVWRR